MHTTKSDRKCRNFFNLLNFMVSNITMKTENDILQSAPELKRMPYSAPEGYFSSLKKGLKEIPLPSEASVPIHSLFLKFIPVAASFAIVAGLGMFFSNRSDSMQELTHEDFLVFSDNYVNTIYYSQDEAQIAEAELADEDIIEYLIYSGISAEAIELSK